MRVGGGPPAQQIEDGVTHVAHPIFDVVAEDPEVEHVPQQVGPAAVQEHAEEHATAEGRIERGGHDLRRLQRSIHAREQAGHDRGLLEEALHVAAHAQLEQEGERVQGDERVVDDGNRAGRDVVAQRDHDSRAWTASRQGRSGGRPAAR